MSKYDFQLDLETKNSTSVIIKMMKENTDVLEIGPAHGRLTKHLKENMNCSVDIVEIDLEAGNHAKQYARNALVGLEAGNVSADYWFETLQDNKYDYIICADVLEHLHNPDKVLERLKSLLKPDGSILISIPNFTHSSVLVNLFNDIFEYNEIGLLDNTHIHFFTYKSFMKMVKDAGLIPVQEDATFAATYKTELKTKLSDVSGSIAKVIMGKKYSNAYQYLFELKDAQNTDKKNKAKPLKDDNEDIKENFYVQIYLYDEKNDIYDEKTSIKKHINPFLQTQKISLDIKGKTKKLRVDPVNAKSMIYINSIMIDDVNISEYVCNGAKFNSMLLFGHDDPQIEINLEKYNISECSRLHMEYKIISFYDDYISELSDNLNQFLADVYSGKESIIKEMDRLITEKDEAITVMDNAISEKDSAIKDMDKAISEKDEAIKVMDKAISEKDSAIKGMDKAISEKDEAIKVMDKAINEKDSAIKGMDKAIAEKDEAIKVMDKAISEKDEAIIVMDKAIAEKDEGIKNMIAAIEERDIAIEKMNNHINELNQQAALIDNEIIARYNKIAELDEAINKKYAMLKSVINFFRLRNKGGK